MYRNTEVQRAALQNLRTEMGSWTKVMVALNEHMDDGLSQTMYNLVAHSKRNNKKVARALEQMGLVEPAPVICRRCWKGSGEEAILLDRWLSRMGYKNLNQYVNLVILAGRGREEKI